MAKDWTSLAEWLNLAYGDGTEWDHLSIGERQHWEIDANLVRGQVERELNRD